MDLDKLGALLTLLREHDVSQFSWKDANHSLRLHIGHPPAAAAPAAIHHAIHPAPAPAAALAAAAGAEGGLTLVEAPMVGTFYTSSSPGAEPFAPVGKHVTVGQTLCIIEAMKLMNQIEAEVSGTVAEVLVKDGQAVEYGQPIFKIRPG